MDEYVNKVGKVLRREEGVTVKELENVLNEYALKGYELVSLHQYIFDGLCYSMIMKRKVN